MFPAILVSLNIAFLAHARWVSLDRGDVSRGNIGSPVWGLWTHLGLAGGATHVHPLQLQSAAQWRSLWGPPFWLAFEGSSDFENPSSSPHRVLGLRPHPYMSFLPSFLGPGESQENWAFIFRACLFVCLFVFGTQGKPTLLPFQFQEEICPTKRSLSFLQNRGWSNNSNDELKETYVDVRWVRFLWRTPAFHG